MCAYKNCTPAFASCDFVPARALATKQPWQKQVRWLLAAGKQPETSHSFVHISKHISQRFPTWRDMYTFGTSGMAAGCFGGSAAAAGRFLGGSAAAAGRFIGGSAATAGRFLGGSAAATVRFLRSAAGSFGLGGLAAKLCRQARDTPPPCGRRGGRSMTALALARLEPWCSAIMYIYIYIYISHCYYRCHHY